MTTLENENFLRLTLLVFECGSFIARHMLYREVGLSGNSLDTLLKRHQEKLLKTITRKYAEKLFPQNGQSDPESWDFALLSTVLLHVFLYSLSTSEKKQLEKLRYIRHEISHASSPTSDIDTYNHTLGNITLALEKLCKKLNTGIGEECKNLVSKYSKEPLDHRYAIEYMKEHSERVELFQTILSKFESVDEGLSEIAGALAKSKEEILEEVKATKGELIEELKALLVEKNHIPIDSVLGIKIKVEKVNSEDRQFIQKMFIEVVEQFANNPEDTKEVKEAIQRLLVEINKIKGAKVDTAEQSSILLKVKCTSLGGVLALLQYLDSASFRLRLRTISEEIQTKTGISCTLSMHETMENYEKIRQILRTAKCEHDIAAYQKKVGGELAVTLPVRVTAATALLDLWSLFEEGKAGNTLSRISRAFSTMTGRSILVSAEVDLEQFRKAVQSIEQLKRGLNPADSLKHISRLIIPQNSVVGRYDPLKRITIWSLESTEFAVAVSVVPKAKSVDKSPNRVTISNVMATTESFTTTSHQDSAVVKEKSESNGVETTTTSLIQRDMPSALVTNTKARESESAQRTPLGSIITRTTNKRNRRLHRLEETLTKTILEKKEFRSEQEIHQEINILATSVEIVSGETAKLLEVFVTKLDIMIQKKPKCTRSKLDSAVNTLITLIHNVNDVYIYEIVDKCVLLKIRCSTCHSMRELLKTFLKPDFENAVKRIANALQDDCPNVTCVNVNVSNESIRDVEAHLKGSGIEIDQYDEMTCSIHPEESVKLYCSDHFLFCCQQCAPEKHGSCPGLRQITRISEDEIDGKKEIVEHRIKVKKDKSTCDIYGCCVLPNGDILIVDNSNKRLKKLNQNFQVVSHISMSDKPWDVCNVENNEAAVALYDCVQLINYEGKLKRTRFVKFDHDSNGIAYNGKQFFVVDDWNVYSYTSDFQNKTVLYSCEAGKVWFNHIVISQRRDLIYISDRYGGVQIIGTDGKHICTLKPDELQNTWGICLDSTDRLLVTDADTCCIYCIDYEGDKTSMDPVVTQNDFMSKPMCLSYDGKRSSLIIGHYQKDTVSVMEMK
ncbi:uncharacterized protein LOC128556840 [Mercenaria mercenaria]|uniref:uncharacterized protein LOC128556840 n=1 Tax=Mercenaria mercenaria TaxID=6596 RepID=UPI00234E97EE|nr:uncharacterized protein LOC128556840 [Mercenaria mercenaria]